MIRQKFAPCTECGDERGRKRQGIRGPRCDRHAPRKAVKPIHDDPTAAAEARALGCAVSGKVGKQNGRSWLHVCDGPIDAHHIKSRGASGKNDGNTVGLCRRAHQQLHQWGAKSFPAIYDVNLWAAAPWGSRGGMK